MRHNMLMIALICLSRILHAQADALQHTIDGLIEQSFPHATVGVFIKDAQSEGILYERHANKLLSPASNIKMLTAAAAFYHLGPEDRYRTTLSRDKHNIYITFTGSPAFTTDDLKQLLSHLKQQGIKTIPGNVVLDTSQFKPPYHPAGSNYDDLGWYYDAPSTAVILDGNAVAFDFISAETLNKPIKIKPEKPNNTLHLINNVRSVSKAQAKEHCSLNIEMQPNNTVQLYGCLAQDKKPLKMQLALPNPNLYAKQIIKTALKENNIVLSGDIIEGHRPPQTQTIAIHQSDELKQLLTHMLLESDNLFAGSVTKRLAHSITGEGTYKQGAFAIKQILAKHTKLDVKQLQLADGDGTRYNLITPKQTALLLSDLLEDKKISPMFIDALPIMGVSGTLKGRMKKTVLENTVKAKTGSMHDISALSGYLLLPKDKTIIFSIISNNITGDYSNAKKLEDNILLAVYSSLQTKDRVEAQAKGN